SAAAASIEPVTDFVGRSLPGYRGSRWGGDRRPCGIVVAQCWCNIKLTDVALDGRLYGLRVGEVLLEHHEAGRVRLEAPDRGHVGIELLQSLAKVWRGDIHEELRDDHTEQRELTGGRAHGEVFAGEPVGAIDTRQELHDAGAVRRVPDRPVKVLRRESRVINHE